MRSEGNNDDEMALPFCLLCQFSIVLLCQSAGGITDMKLEHSFPRVGARQWDIDAFLEPRGGGAQRADQGRTRTTLPSLNSVVQRPWNVGGSKDKHTGVIVTNAVHLHQKLRLDTSRTLRLALVTGPNKRINFIDEYDGWFVFSRHLEQLPYEPEITISAISISEIDDRKHQPF